MEYVTKGELTEASSYYEANKMAMQDEDTANTVRMIAAQLDRMERSQAVLLSASLLHTAKWYDIQENWHYLQENITKSQSIIEAYNSNALLLMQANPSEIDNLRKALKMVDSKYQQSISKIFNKFNHFSGKNFFNIIPVIIKNKEKLFLSSYVPKAIKSANLKKIGIFYRAYHNTLDDAYMISLRRSIIKRSIRRFLVTHKRLTLFENHLFEKYLSTIQLSSNILNLQTKPIIYIVDKHKLVSTESSFTFSTHAIKSIFSDAITEDSLSPYAVVIVPRTRKVKIVNSKITSIPSKFQSGYVKKPNPKFKERKIAKQKLVSAVTVASSEFNAIKQEIYRVTQKASLKENDALTGQLTEHYSVTIPEPLLEKKSKAMLKLKQVVADLEKAEVSLLQTDKEISVPIYKDYQIQQKDLELEKIVGVDFYIKKSFQKGYYKYSDTFSERKKLTLFEKVQAGDELMLKRQREALDKFKEYKGMDMKISKDISDLNLHINIKKSVVTLH